MALSIFPCPAAPSLPEFKTLLIQGNYPPSSPFHLCLSHMSSAGDLVQSQPRSTALLVSAMHRSRIIKELVSFNDDWLATSVGLGASAALLSNLRIYYPSTPSHWIFLFSLFQNGTPDAEGLHPNPNIYVDPPVSLLVLHEPSAYFWNHGDAGSFSMASYMRLITSALASLSFLSSGTSGLPARLVVFDSRIHDLSLPIPFIVSDGHKREVEGKYEKLAPAVEKYFEWVGKVET